MIDKTKKEIQNAKRRATMWSIMAVLMMVIAVSMVVMISIISDIPAWAKLLMGLLIFATGQGLIAFLSLASYENDYIDELENYLNKIEELDNEIAKL